MDPEVLKAMIESDDLGLLDLPPVVAPITAADRSVAGFEEVVEFVKRHDREPAENPADMTETRLAWRLAAIRADEMQLAFLRSNDELGLLREPEPPTSLEDVFNDDPLGLLDSPADIFDLKHVPKKQTMPDDIAMRRPCADFDEFEPKFRECQRQLREGVRTLARFSKPSEMRVGRFYVLNGVLVYIAAIGEETYDEVQKKNARIRAVFENGTESDMLLQSLASNLYKDGGRLITEPAPVTKERLSLEDGTDMGVLYVLRSMSDLPEIQAIPNLHKIGFSRRSVFERIKGAANSTTYLLGPVRVVDEYEVPASIAPKIEHLLHRFFAEVRLDVRYEIRGVEVAECKEWFSVPNEVIADAIDLISNNTIDLYEYDHLSESLRLR